MNKQQTSNERRRKAYTIIKLLAKEKGVPLPNARNRGIEFDKWLEEMHRKAELDEVWRVAYNQ